VLFKFVSIVALGAIELWAAIPAGLALGLHPFLVSIGAAMGDIALTLLVIIAGGKIRNWAFRRFHRGNRKIPDILQKIWEHQGAIGLGLLAPLLTGAPLGAAIGVSLGVEPKKLVLWMSLGIILWSVILTIAAYWGLVAIKEVL
jgi:hypothetical protein